MNRWSKDRRAGALARPSGAFTLLELAVVLAMLAILAATLLPALTASNERTYRAQCAGNLRQIGVGCSLYTADNNGYLPQQNWPQNQNPWQTYEACRCTPGTGTISRGPYNLALLYTTRELASARVFYCPSAAKRAPTMTYDYYASTGQWPSMPALDDNVRLSYDYYPQSKALATDPASGYKLPSMTYATVIFKSPNPNDPPQVPLMEPVRLKITQIDLQRSVATDDLQSLSTLFHHDGVNALFGDGHVKFQSAQGNPQALAPNLWTGLNGSDSSISTPCFRRVMSLWQP